MDQASPKLSFTIPVARGAQRFRELIVYISQRSAEDPHFGAVKLNKILYHSDFRAYERFGVPLTGVCYFRLKAGPAPKALLPVRRGAAGSECRRGERCQPRCSLAHPPRQGCDAL